MAARGSWLLLGASRRATASAETAQSGRSGWMVAAALSAAVAVLLVDLVISSRSWSIPILGVLDELGHLLTAAIIIAALPLSASCRLVPWALLGAVVIDADHVPLYTIAREFSVGGRPPTHSLLTALVLLLLGFAAPAIRMQCFGLSLGVCLHFVRDVSTGPGLPLFWPASDDALRLSYGVYVVILLGSTAAAVARLLRRRKLFSPRST